MTTSLGLAPLTEAGLSATGAPAARHRFTMHDLPALVRHVFAEEVPGWLGRHLAAPASPSPRAP